MWEYVNASNESLQMKSSNMLLWVWIMCGEIEIHSQARIKNVGERNAVLSGNLTLVHGPIKRRVQNTNEGLLSLRGTVSKLMIPFNFSLHSIFNIRDDMWSILHCTVRLWIYIILWYVVYMNVIKVEEWSYGNDRGTLLTLSCIPCDAITFGPIHVCTCNNSCNIWLYVLLTNKLSSEYMMSFINALIRFPHCKTNCATIREKETKSLFL